MAIFHLYRWSVIGDPYKPPEDKALRLSGFRDQDEKQITTSVIVDVKGREVTTYSGSTYILEDVDPDYLKFLDATGEVYNPENPIRVKN